MSDPVPTPGEPPPRVRLHLLGSFWLEVGGSPVPLPLGAQRLVALLALRGRLSRSRAAGLLWPDASQGQAATNLRKVLWRLHRALPAVPLVVSNGNDLESPPHVVDDVALLARAARDCWLSPSPGPQPGLRAAVDMLGSDATDLLPDWDEEWLSDDRERVRQLRLHLLETWADALTAAGAYGLALEAALSALRSDPLRESAHRTVIRVHRAEGNASEARRAFQFCRTVLSREIGIPPSQETAALVP